MYCWYCYDLVMHCKDVFWQFSLLCHISFIRSLHKFWVHHWQTFCYRLFAVIVIILLSASLGLTWFFPSERKSQGIYLSSLLVSMAIFYFLLPLSATFRNESFRNHIQQKFRLHQDPLTAMIPFRTRITNKIFPA